MKPSAVSRLFLLHLHMAGKNKKTIAGYMRNRLQEGLTYEQMSIRTPDKPFVGEPVRASKKTSQPPERLARFSKGFSPCQHDAITG